MRIEVSAHVDRHTQPQPLKEHVHQVAQHAHDERRNHNRAHAQRHEVPREPVGPERVDEDAGRQGRREIKQVDAGDHERAEQKPAPMWPHERPQIPRASPQAFLFHNATAVHDEKALGPLRL